MRSNKKSIMIVSSVSFYEHVLQIEKELKKYGFNVRIPVGAVKMKRGFDSLAHKKKFVHEQNWKEKKRLILKNFEKILASDYLLVVNDEKNDLKGYIGGNVLMEMTLAFHYRKPIYILNVIDERLSIYEEVYGMQPTFIAGDLQKIV